MPTRRRASLLRGYNWVNRCPADAPVRHVFGDGAGFCIEMVKALDAAHAQDIAEQNTPPEGCRQYLQSCSMVRTATSCCG